ncbi:MAG: CBS domain-containing protein [Clostridiaceae bacterium]|nr:CBS domain-containing protein [Clostridiaceae bacterium]
MINKDIKEVLLNHKDPLMISAENVATVRGENTLLHAMMILSNVGYSSIPVVDNDQRHLGIVTIPNIVEGIKDQISYNWDLLAEKEVEDIICTDCSICLDGSDFEEIMRQLVDHNYVSIVDKNNVFQGIITRKTVMQRLNSLLHELDKVFEITPKRDLIYVKS